MARIESDPELIDTQHPEDKALVHAAQCFVLTQRACKEWAERRAEEAEALALLMHERGLTVYAHDGVRITLESVEKVRVKIDNGGDDDVA